MNDWELKWLNVLKYVKRQVDNEYESSNAVTQEELRSVPDKITLNVQIYQLL